jgi:hypothetical protein
MYMKSVCFSTFILHISGTDKCKIGVRYLIFRPVIPLKMLLFAKNLIVIYKLYMNLLKSYVINLIL